MGSRAEPSSGFCVVAERGLAAAAGAAARPGQGDPPVNLNVPADRDAWVNLDPNRFNDLCEQACLNGDFSYVQTALLANRYGLATFINERATQGRREVSNAEAFQMLQSARKTNS
eukprot:7689282-Pyramimonas_sp.AAC.1